jgi:hypothetical protein
MDVILQEAMLDNAREKEKRLDGSQCLKRKGTKEIKNVEKHIKEKRSNTYISKLPMVVSCTCVCYGVLEEGSTTRIFFANHGGTLQNHVPRAV